MNENTISEKVIGCAIEVHRLIGPALLESIYEDALSKIDKPQLLTYLRLSRKRLGLIINFHVKVLKDGIHRVVNNLKE